jgi:hypothetical protein
MRPHVGEQMSRQPSLPSITNRANLVRTSRLTRANKQQHSSHLEPGTPCAPPPHHPHTDQRLQRSHPQSHLTRPRSFTHEDGIVKRRRASGSCCAREPRVRWLHAVCCCGHRPGRATESRSRSHSFAGSAVCRLHDDGVRVGLLSHRYGRGTVVLATKELELTRRWDQLLVERPGTCPHL